MLPHEKGKYTVRMFITILVLLPSFTEDIRLNITIRVSIDRAIHRGKLNTDITIRAYIIPKIIFFYY